MQMKKEVRQTTIKKRDNYIHIETPLGIINIWPGLVNNEEQKVDAISIHPDSGVVFDKETLRLIQVKKEE